MVAFARTCTAFCYIRERVTGNTRGHDVRKRNVYQYK